MNLKVQWESLSKTDNDLSGLIETGARSLSSKDPLQKVKKKLAVNSLLGGAIFLGYEIILMRFPGWELMICTAMLMLFTLWTIFKNLQLYLQIKEEITETNALHEMERHYNAIRKLMEIQPKVGLLFYPASIAEGFMMGASLSSHKSIDEIMHWPVMIVSLDIMIVVFVPICFWLAKYFAEKAFGEYARQLKMNIDTLRSQD